MTIFEATPCVKRKCDFHLQESFLSCYILKQSAFAKTKLSIFFCWKIIKQILRLMYPFSAVQYELRTISSIELKLW